MHVPRGRSSPQAWSVVGIPYSACPGLATCAACRTCAGSNPVHQMQHTLAPVWPVCRPQHMRPVQDACYMYCMALAWGTCCMRCPQWNSPMHWFQHKGPVYGPNMEQFQIWCMELIRHTACSTCTLDPAEAAHLWALSGLAPSLPCRGKFSMNSTYSACPEPAPCHMQPVPHGLCIPHAKHWTGTSTCCMQQALLWAR